jgi:hypothetical protein
MRPFFPLLAIAIAFSSSALADAPTADPTAKVAEARAAFEKGANFASAERWNDALAAFSESAALRPHATTTYNIGYCERALGHATRAKKHFALALEQDQTSGGTELTPELRAASKKYFDEVKTQIAAPKLNVPADVAIAIDGRPLEKSDGGGWLAGTRPTGPGEKTGQTVFVVEIDAGAHEIVISSTDGRSRVAHEYFPAGSTKEVTLTLPPPVITTAPIVDRGRARRTWGYAVGGLGLVGLGVGAYFGLAARSSWSKAKEACPARDNCSDSAVRLSTDARTEANISTIAFVAGGAAILGGTILILTAGSPTSEKPKTTVTGAIDPRGGAFLGVVGSF